MNRNPNNVITVPKVYEGFVELKCLHTVRRIASSLTGLYTIAQVQIITSDNPNHFESDTQSNSTQITQITQKPITQGPRPTSIA